MPLSPYIGLIYGVVVFMAKFAFTEPKQADYQYEI